MTLPLAPFEFALGTPCFACGALVGEKCQDHWRTGTEVEFRRDVPHFGRAGMPSARGWMLNAEKGPI